MATKATRKLTAEMNAIVADIQSLESRAHKVGLTITGHALNNAKNTVGWEIAGNTDRATKAAKGDR